MDQAETQNIFKKANYFDRFHFSLAPQGQAILPEKWFVFTGKRVLLKKDGGQMRIPLQTDFGGLGETFISRQYLGEVDGAPCYCMETASDTPAPGMSYEPIRSLVAYDDGSELFKIAGFAYHLMNWNRVNTFCGHCGGRMQDKADERAKFCPDCGNTVYPRISPATITAVIRGDEILLAHNNSFKDGLYSLIAGFVEPGETLEDCVKREIFEETCVQIKNTRYFGSQPWPFPDSLMAAFTAEYAGNKVKADGVEIGDARWFHRGSLPLIPGTESIAGRIIRWFEDGCK